MDPRSEASATIRMVSAIAPWVLPATAAILVGGLIVVSSLVGGPGQCAPLDTDGTIRQGISAADRVTTNSENRPDVRTN
jgi:hypothetical protein